MPRSPEAIENICRELLNKRIGLSALNVSLEEFRDFYKTIKRLSAKEPVVSIINLETIAVAQFSSISPQHFDVMQSAPITAELFDFVENKNWYGPNKAPQSFANFVWKEFLLNKGKLVTIFIISALLIFMIDSGAFYQLIASFLIQSGTVFLSLYIIFTVSQSQTLFKDIPLLKMGTLHRYYRHDRNITLLGILTIALTFLCSGIVSLSIMLDQMLQITWLLFATRIIRAAFTALVITMLFDTFFTVANYYLDRSRDVLERDLVATILDEDYRKHGM